MAAICLGLNVLKQLTVITRPWYINTCSTVPQKVRIGWKDGLKLISRHNTFIWDLKVHVAFSARKP